MAVKIQLRLEDGILEINYPPNQEDVDSFFSHLDIATLQADDPRYQDFLDSTPHHPDTRHKWLEGRAVIKLRIKQVMKKAIYDYLKEKSSDQMLIDLHNNVPILFGQLRSERGIDHQELIELKEEIDALANDNVKKGLAIGEHKDAILKQICMVYSSGAIFQEIYPQEAQQYWCELISPRYCDDVGMTFDMSAIEALDC